MPINTLAQRLKAGTVWINTFWQTQISASFGGYKMSGIGRERGLSGLEEHCEEEIVWGVLNETDIGYFDNRSRRIGKGHGNADKTEYRVAAGAGANRQSPLPLLPGLKGRQFRLHRRHRARGHRTMSGHDDGRQTAAMYFRRPSSKGTGPFEPIAFAAHV